MMSENAKHALRISGAIAGLAILYLLWTGRAAPTSADTATDTTPDPYAGAASGLDFPPQSGPNVYNVGAYNPTPTGGFALPGYGAFDPPAASSGGCCNQCGPQVGGSGIVQNIGEFTRFV